MNEVLTLKGWDDNNELNTTFEDSDIKYLNQKASKLHTDVEKMNNFIVIGEYTIDTFITGSESKNHYMLKVKIKYYEPESEHEHKENTHGQKINI